MVENRRPPLPPPTDFSSSSSAQTARRISRERLSRQATSSSSDDEHGTSEHLNVAERWWRSHQPWLERCGYLLRVRYRRNWVPSWERKGFFSGLHKYEDMVALPVGFSFGAKIWPPHFNQDSPYCNPGHVEKNRCDQGIGRVACSSLPRF